MNPKAPNLRLPRLYKTLLALALVLGPMAWLLFTLDGQRRTDLALMALLGRPAFDAALDAFSDRLTETSLRQTFPALTLDCGRIRPPFGDRLCTAAIGSFNHYPARALSLYFQGERLYAVKVVYQPAYHLQIRAWVEQRPARTTPGDTQPDAGVRSRPVADGTLVMKDGPLGRTDEPALLWLSAGLAAASPLDR